MVIDPLPYHQAMREYLQAEEPDVWHWYASNKVRDEQAEAVRFELLKSTYRVDPDCSRRSTQTARRWPGSWARHPVTIYQAQNPQA